MPRRSDAERSRRSRRSSLGVIKQNSTIGKNNSSLRRKKSKQKVTVLLNNREVVFTKSLRATIVRLQTMVAEMVPKLPFHRVVKEITHQYGEFRYTPEAVAALQMSAELYMTQLFECSNKCAYHAKRVTLMPKDMGLVLDLRGPADPAHNCCVRHN